MGLIINVNKTKLMCINVNTKKSMVKNLEMEKTKGKIGDVNKEVVKTINTARARLSS